MKLLNNKKKMLLPKHLIVLVITLFSVIFSFTMSANAASFRYADFEDNWDNFADEQKSYWEGKCQEDKAETDPDECANQIIKAQEKFYKKLYKLLAKYEKKGLFMQDQIILETVFYDMSPSLLQDDSSEYNEYWQTTDNVIRGADEPDITDDDVDEDKMTSDEMKQYFETEKDTVRLLVKNLVAYKTYCYGVVGDVTVTKLDDGSTRETCPDGGTPTDLTDGQGRKCADKKQENELGYWEYLNSKIRHKNKLATFISSISILGQLFEDTHYEECKSIGEDQYGGNFAYLFEDHAEVSEQKYFEFLVENRYFDNKEHLQKHYEEDIFDVYGVECMTEELCGDKSFEAAGLYDDTEANIQVQLVRQEMVNDIVQILRDYGLTIDYNAVDPYEFETMNEQLSQRLSYYWPIGSDTTEERDGVTYADGDPAYTTVNSYFGSRTDPITGEKGSYHYGVDLAGVEGETNVIAASDGEVVSVVSSCTAGDLQCGGGYGNHIILSHSNGDYTVYAHLYSTNVSVGDAVKKGQVIGIVGNTGNSTGAHLHFEIRIGGNTVGYAVDPLEYISAENSRPVGAGSDFSAHTTSLTREEFISKLSSYCNRTSCSSTFLNVFVAYAGDVYDYSIKYNVNPEFVVVRAMTEGFSPGGNTNNYWGIGCSNTGGGADCKVYSSLEAGIQGLANTSSVKNSETVADVMGTYAYIGDYWYKIYYRSSGSIDWGLGGCAYYPYIKEFMSSSRQNTVSATCNQNACNEDGSGSCVKTNEEDQDAYKAYQVEKKMGPYRYNVFGL